jgi:hypothetical protein
MNNPFSVKNNFKNKHLVLKKLFDKWRVGEEKTNGGFTVTEYGRCLSILELISITNLSKTSVDLIVISLSNKGLIEILALDSDKGQKNHKWIITDLGKEYYANNYFLNERGLFYRKFFVELLSLLIALGALALSIYSSSQNSFLEKQLEQQNQQLQRLERKLLK